VSGLIKKSKNNPASFAVLRVLCGAAFSTICQKTSTAENAGNRKGRGGGLGINT